MSSHRGHIECNCFLVPMFHGEDNGGLFVDRVEFVTSDRLELQWIFSWLGGDS